MRRWRWGVVLGAFAIAVIAFLLWRSSQEASEHAAGPIDAAIVESAALTGTPQPRITRTTRSGAPADRSRTFVCAR